MATTGKAVVLGTPQKSPQRLFVPSKSGKALQSTARRNVLNVYAKIREQNPNESISKVVLKVARLTGVSRTTIFKIKAKAVGGCPPSTPAKKRPGAVGKRTRLKKYDEFTLSSLRRKVHSFFRRNEIPTVQKILQVVNEDKDIFPNKISKSTLNRLLNDLGFKFKKRNRNSALIERTDIILWRRKYLREMKKYRNEKREIYYLDETWVNIGHTKSKVWQDTTIGSADQASKENLTSGLQQPSGKGSRLILTHAGSEDGFVDGAEDLFQGQKKSVDYHDEMDGNRFENWFKTKLLPNVKPQSVIVMDNASYHSVFTEKVPTQSWTKPKIQDWLTSKNISWESDMLKPELLTLVYDVKDKYKTYRIDSIAKAEGHTVLRMPPYHCELNPIELIWSQVKGYVAAKNQTFKLKDVKELFLQGIHKVTAEDWKKAINHVIKKEKEFWNLDDLIEDFMQSHELIINLGESESDENCSDCSGNTSGVEEIEW